MQARCDVVSQGENVKYPTSRKYCAVYKSHIHEE